MWKRLDVIFTLKSPLHIGYLPFKGSVISPTRYYIPGKNFWGAITKRATECFYDNPSSGDYREIGLEIKDNFRFSYFYLYDGNTIFIPKYKDGGLVFGEDDKEQIDKFSFERRFIGSRVLTAIDSKSGTARDESLHEIEFVKYRLRDEKGNIENTRIIGSIWIKEGSNLNDFKIKFDNNGIFVNDFNLIEELAIGGEQGYGFGLVKLESMLSENRFPIKSTPENNDIRINVEPKSPILSHLGYDKNISFQGDIEILIGRGYFDIEKSDSKASEYKKDAGNVITNKGYYFSPGTVVELEDGKFVLGWDGIIRKELGDRSEYS